MVLTQDSRSSMEKEVGRGGGGGGGGDCPKKFKNYLGRRWGGPIM